jgi:membrane-associated phospholipid phosphatase
LNPDSSNGTDQGIRITWKIVRQALTRPYAVTLPMVALVSLVPVYVVIADRVRTGAVHAPELAVDRFFPLVPPWALVYGALYLFLILLPVIVIQQRDLIDRTVWAYLTIWTLSYVFFLLYPTIAPRPAEVTGDGFAVWGLRFLYDADPPYNCFPSLHVAHSFVSALACIRVHRALGLAAVSCASLVAISTLLIKQHYVVDVIAGIFLAVAAYAVFLRPFAHADVPELDRRLAPALALCVVGLVGLCTVCFGVAYLAGAGGRLDKVRAPGDFQELRKVISAQDGNCIENTTP